MCDESAGQEKNGAITHKLWWWDEIAWQKRWALTRCQSWDELSGQKNNTVTHFLLAIGSDMMSLRQNKDTITHKLLVMGSDVMRLLDRN